jgi:ATP-dependent Zn protease
MPSKSMLKRAAYHEAGHVVIAWYYSIGCVGVSIAKEQDSLGAAQIRGLFGKVPLQAHQLERELDIAMAGVAAEEKFTGKKLRGWGGNDYMNAVKIAAQWSEQTIKTFDNAYLVDTSIEVDQTTGCLFSAGFLDEFATNVRQLISRAHIWGCVEAVARKLIEKGALSSQEVTDIISVTWEELDGDEQELIIEKQQFNSSQRPWGEWRPE